MTTENSVRVPDKGPWRWHPNEPYVLQSDDFSHDARIVFSGDFADHDDVMRYKDWLLAKLNAAAPAPAGSHRSTHHVWRDLASVTESWPCYCGAETDHVIGNEATPQPEQGAGLANAVYATVREALACDCNDTEDQVCDKCQALTAIIDLEERALARQQSRVVCVWALDHSGEAWDTGCGQLWQFMADGPVENNVHFCHFCGNKVEVAALEGDRDGR